MDDDKLEEFERRMWAGRILYRDALDVPVYDEDSHKKAEEYFQRAEANMTDAMQLIINDYRGLDEFYSED